MEKKQYIAPATEIVEAELDVLMEIASAALDSDTEIGNPEGIGSREFDLWED